MLGPVFVREAIAVPRRSRSYLGRSIYVLSLFLLLCTGYLVLSGTQPLSTASDLARFGGWMFLLLAPLQLLVLGFQASVSAASSVAQEKDRRTLVLLLLTRITGFELVVGKLTANLLGVLGMLLAGIPLFVAITLFGGVSNRQLCDVYLVTLITLLAASCVGTVVGLWREKSFQTIAVTLLLITLWIGFWEVVAAGVVPGVHPEIAKAMSPARALLIAAQPLESPLYWGLRASLLYALNMALVATAVASWGMFRVRTWNPPREVRPQRELEVAAKGDEETSTLSWKTRSARRVWENPVLWREVRTRAYGSKIFFIKAAYFVLFALIAASVFNLVQSGAATQRPEVSGRVLPAATLPMAGILVISLVMVNALGVNSITSERDLMAIDLLLVTDLTPREFVFGKMFGVLYITKEMILLPLALTLYLAVSGVIEAENAVYAIIAGIVLFLFAATLGIHCGLNYPAGRTATLVSLGTVFFLCVGIAVCMVIMVSFRGAFQLQLAPFLIIILGGGAALYAAIGWRNPSSAIFAASIALPLVTYYAITQFLLQHDQLPVAATLALGYGFATVAMLVPALSEFDVADPRDRGSDAEAGV